MQWRMQMDKASFEETEVQFFSSEKCTTTDQKLALAICTKYCADVTRLLSLKCTLSAFKHCTAVLAVVLGEGAPCADERHQYRKNWRRPTAQTFLT